MNDLQILTSARLKQLIEQTQLTLNDLKKEVERRESQAQEHQIMNLESHMKSAELSLTSIQSFLQYLKSN